MPYRHDMVSQVGHRLVSTSWHTTTADSVAAGHMHGMSSANYQKDSMLPWCLA
jgi:hypothetical protein